MKMRKLNWFLSFTIVATLSQSAFGAANFPSGPQDFPVAEQAPKGRELVNKILSEQPVQSRIDTGVLKIRNADGDLREVPLKSDLIAGVTNWTSLYQAAADGKGTGVELKVVHHETGRNDYLLAEGGKRRNLSGNETMIPFADSDFWVADLGLEFFHWPKQLLLRQEIRRGQSCNVLESFNPNPAPGAYSRVVSWLDIDTDGIIHADAYDSNDKLLKQFDPKSFKKVRGQWELREMEIDNVQANTRTQIEFNLSKGG